MINRRRDEAARIRARYGDVVVDVTSVAARAAEEVDVPTIEALVHLAERCGRPVCHLNDVWTGAHVYFVDDGGVRYRYGTGGGAVRPGRRVTV